jgi:nitrite reductase (NO-forming)
VAHVRAAGAGVAGRRCRARPRRPGELRPTDVAGAFFVAGIAFLAAGVVAGVANEVLDVSRGRWLALHLAFVGGISQLVIGASQFFAGAFLATDPPPRRLVRAQLSTWNAGALLLAVAVPQRSAALVWIAVGLLVSGLALYAAGLVAMRRRSLRRAPWATRWYALAAGALACGIVAGAMMALGVAWRHGDLLGAHLTCNLLGWFGGAIVGTLHTFYPSLTQTLLRLPRLQDVALAGWGLGVVALALGFAFDLPGAVIAGWICLAVAAVALLANVAASLRAAPMPLALPARLVGVAQLFLAAGLLLAVVAVLADGPDALRGSTRAALATLLVFGWIGITVMGSLLHLLAVIVRVRRFAFAIPPARPRRDSAITAAVALGVAALAVAQLAGAEGWRAPALIALLAAYAVIGALVARLAVRVLAVARPGV